MDKQSLKLGARILENLPEMDSQTIQTWIDDPKRLQVALQRVFTRSQIKIWRTIKIWDKSPAEFRNAINRFGKIGDLANILLDKLDLNHGYTELSLVNISVAELGLRNEARLSDIYNRAEQLGLRLCPDEVGPQLRLQYRDQPKGEWLQIAMKPITGLDEHQCLFQVGRDNDGLLWLHGDNRGSFDSLWNSDEHMVFVIPRE